MSRLDDIEYRYLHESFRLDKGTDILYWRERPRRHFNSDSGWRIFNSKHAGKIAGSPQQGSVTWDNRTFSLARVKYYLENRRPKPR